MSAPLRDLDMRDCWTFITYISHTYTLWSKASKGALSGAAWLTTHNSIKIEGIKKCKYCNTVNGDVCVCVCGVCLWGVIAAGVQRRMRFK